MPNTSTLTTPVASASHPHTLISIEGIQPGMVLARPVYDAAERLLAAAGTLLTVRHQRQMRQRGVTMVAVAVKDTAVTRDDGVAVGEPSAAAAELVERAQNDPFMRELVVLARTRHARRHHLTVAEQEEPR